ncbi:MAG: hypothetical protein Aureis2KO_04020 [Aureisphaera sp.]
MKRISLISGCLIALLFLGSATKSNSPENTISLEGVWELQHQYLFDDNQIQDTLFNLEGYRQVKMYSKGKIMWTRFNPKDTNEWFGYGTYKIVDGYLEEQLEYASNEMMKIVDTVQVFRFALEMGPNSYSQISFDADGNRYNSENYVKIE